jgi:protein tyrosine/serine phosphatase
MRNKSSWLPVMLVLVCAAAGCQTTSRNGQRVSGFTNFGVVSDGFLYRGDAPRSEADIRYLASKLGVRTIIDLREDGADDGDLKQERQWAEHVSATDPAHPIRWVNFPSDAFRPADEMKHFRDFLARKDLPEDQGGLVGPFFVHCQYGRDRTGLWCACYRISQGSDATLAANEMRDFGQNFVFVPGLYNYVRREAKAGVTAAPSVAVSR